MKTLLLLGGSFQQLVAIRAAKKLGYRTVLCDYLPDNPGQYEADRFYLVSTTDIEAVCEIAEKECVDGILPYASDPAAYPASIVCEKLRLPTNPSGSVEILGVKHKFRDFLQSKKFPCPKHFSFTKETTNGDIISAVESFQYPLVLKPTDSSGSKGITKFDCKQDFVNNIDAAINHAEEYSRNGILIIEEFIERGYPYVIGGDIFIVDGKIILFGEMDCLRDQEGRGLIPIGKRWPCQLSEVQRRNLHNELQRLIDALGINMGEMNIELILDKNDQPRFLELGPRAGGNMIPIQLSDAYGVDLVRANVQAALGIEPEINTTENSGCYMHYVLHTYTSGRFGGLTIDKHIKPYIYRECIYKKVGDPVEYFDGAGKALGILFLRFGTVEQMDFFCNNKDKLIHPIIL